LLKGLEYPETDKKTFKTKDDDEDEEALESLLKLLEDSLF
jgi:hypothetical protein